MLSAVSCTWHTSNSSLFVHIGLLNASIVTLSAVVACIVTFIGFYRSMVSVMVKFRRFEAS